MQTQHRPFKSAFAFAGFALLALAASAQTSSSSAPSNPPPKDDEPVVELPQFSVTADGDEGWTASSSMSGTRTNVPIQNLPRSIQVLTSEFMADIGADTLSDAAAFMTGVTSQGRQDAVFDNNTFTLRGLRQNRHYRDGVKEGFVGMISDSATVDRVEVLRGPSSLLAGVSEPGGMINQISKRPRAKNQSSIKVTLGSWDYQRVEADVSYNLTKRLAVRAVGAFQDSNSWRAFEGSKRKTGYVAASYKLGPHTMINARAEAIDYDAVLGLAIPGWRLPTGTTATSATASVVGYVPEFVVPWDFNPFGPNNNRNQEVYRIAADFQHQFNSTFSMRLFSSWSLSDRRDQRLSGNASTIIARYVTPSLGIIPGNVYADEIRWAATRDDERWDINTYQADFRGVFRYWKLKHEAILGLERIESNNERDRSDTPNSTSTSLGAAASTNPNALTRYKFPTSFAGALPAGSYQPAWDQMLDVNRYSVPNSYVNQDTTRGAVSFTNVISSQNDEWHALLGARRDHGKNSAVTGTTSANALPQSFPIENATSETFGILYRPIPSFSVYTSYSSSFSGVPTGIDVYGNLLTKPESGKSFEAGIKSSFWNGKLSLEAAGFKLNRTNTRRQLSSAEIIAVLGFEPSGTRSTQDNGEESVGAEAQLLFRPFKAYQVAANFSYVTTNLVSPDNAIRDGGPITGRPRSSGSVFQKYAFNSGKFKGLSLTAGVIWVDSFRPDSISSSTGLVQNWMPGYIRVDGGASWRVKLGGQPYTVTFNVRNAGNTKYYEGLQSKGDLRSYRVGLSTKF